MSRETAIAELLSITLRLKSEISRLRDGCTSTDLSRLQMDLRSGRQCIDALRRDHDVSPELTAYRNSLEELLELLPRLRIRSLVEKMRIEEASHKLSAIREWARSATTSK